MSESSYKLASFCAYQVVDTYIDKMGEEIVVCKTPNVADTFEMTATTVRTHEAINELTYLRINAAQGYCRQGESFFDDIAQDAKAMAVMDQLEDDKHPYFIADFLNKTVEAMSEDDVREFVLHKYRIPSEEIDGAMIYMRHSTSSNYKTIDDRDVFAGIVSSFMAEYDEGLPEEPFIGVVIASSVDALVKQVEAHKGKSFDDEVMLAHAKAMPVDDNLDTDIDNNLAKEQDLTKRYKLNDIRTIELKGAKRLKM